jgi:hypothetical protein
VQEAPAFYLSAICGDPERHQAMPLDATTVGASSVEARRKAMRSEVAVVAAERTFARKPAIESIKEALEIALFWGPVDGSRSLLIGAHSVASGKQGPHSES